ncbi:NAD-binding protein [Hydrogenimonas cancrithermarum]|uniref:Trk system potassium uptake protein TrkA n=1 Tax=Hydrogenimonas cancrithermarum TaxID=2993563 RepID=A0ABM8FJB1_9BACT|nr:NAD-binding protein [Hydrogenimonas cancrithermarum]BDY11706.1 Trk system potassium transport protein TrkA [Hydrogenimonas cancrithermarum]
MDIIIAGAGRVGFNLARTLSIGHNVTVIDRNAEALQRLQESLDILPLHGDIEDPLTYRKLIDKEVHLFIAVTDMDEANLISTLIVDDSIRVDRKFIRLRNTFFAKSSIREKLGVNEAIFPMQITSKTVETLLQYPKANNVKTFKYTNLKLVSVRASGLSEPLSLHPEGFAIVGIEREKDFFIPSMDTPIEPGDLVYLFGNEESIRQLCGRLESESPRTISRCVIFGAGDLGVAIAHTLIENGKEVKLVEKDVKLCEAADEKLEGEATAISCKYGTGTIFEEEGLENADLMIAATDNDEYNIIKCLEAREHGIRKVVAINNEMEYYNLMHTLGIVVVRGPKMSAYNAILESIYSSGVVMERKFCGGKASIFLRKIFPNSKLIDKRVKPFKRQKAGLVFLVREGELSRFDETVTMREGDVIIGFVDEEYASAMKVWIYGL